MAQTPPVGTDLGLYVHVPFCARRCEFCAFYTAEPRRGDIDRYLCCVEKELASLHLPRRADTVFFGGGTPGLLPPKDLERLTRATLEAAGGTPEEWTVELTPASARPDRLKVLREAGVNRISIGVQSFDEAILHALGRIHTVKQVYEAIDAVRNIGFDNLNLDMMFALPGQSLDEWETDLRRAIAAGPEHISTYCLMFEENTALYVRLLRGQTAKRTPDEEAVFYERTWDILENAGLAQYEVSNFARPGRECRHNLNTWRMREWVGVGPSAASQFAMHRYTNVPALAKWAQGIENGHPARIDEELLTEETLAQDSLIFGLRMTKGVDFDELAARFPAHDWAKEVAVAESLRIEGLAEFDSHRLRLTPKGRLVTDQVALLYLDDN
jgi:oxygen-independent coproporphyrinogen-3 oxidase